MRTIEQLKFNFENYIIKDPDTKCWGWKGAKNNSGYGHFYLGPGYPGGYKGVGAHVAAYYLYKGAYNNSLYLCHICDNKLCVNPDHLFLGTPSENMKDAKKKGRLVSPEHLSDVLKIKARRGEQHHKTHLKAEDIRLIRKLYSEGISYYQLASQFNLTAQGIYKIAKYIRWKHIQ